MFLISKFFPKQTLKLLNQPSFLSLVSKPSLFLFSDSESFKERDKVELTVYHNERLLHWKFKKIRDAWKVPLEKKRLRRQRLALTPKVTSNPQKISIF